MLVPLPANSMRASAYSPTVSPKLLVAISAPEVLEASLRIASPLATLTLLAEVVTLFWLVHPLWVSQTSVLSEFPLNSSSKTSDQLPSTPAGVGSEAAEEDALWALGVELPVGAIDVPVVVVGLEVVLVVDVVVVGVVPVVLVAGVLVAVDVVVVGVLVAVGVVVVGVVLVVRVVFLVGVGLPGAAWTGLRGAFLRGRAEFDARADSMLPRPVACSFT
jgi:hypothetical protein